MPVYSYTGINENGETVFGELTATNEGHAYDIGLDKGEHIVSLKIKEAKAKKLHNKTFDSTHFLNDLAQLIEAKFPLIDALLLRREITESKKEFVLLGEIIADLKDGVALSSSIAMYDKEFPLFVSPMIRAGEESGDLASALNDIVRDLERKKQINKSLTQALTYPAILSSGALIAMIFIFTFILPKFESMFKDMGKPLPTFTQWVFDLGHSFTSIMPWFLLVVLTGTLLFRYLPRNHRIRIDTDQLLLRIPLFGRIQNDAQTAQYTGILGQLIDRSVTLPSALEIASDSITNRYLHQYAVDLSPAIRNGQTLANSMEGSGIWSTELVEYVRLGERSGLLGKQLLRHSDNLRQRLEQHLNQMISLLQPTLVLLIGVLIGGIVAAMMMALLDMNNLTG